MEEVKFRIDGNKWHATYCNTGSDTVLLHRARINTAVTLAKSCTGGRLLLKIVAPWTNKKICSQLQWMRPQGKAKIVSIELVIEDSIGKCEASRVNCIT